jgi:hypothetical protein
MLFGSAVLEVAISLFFIFFLGGVIVSAIREVIAAMFQARAKFLREGLTELFSPSGGETPSNPPDEAVKVFIDKTLKSLLTPTLKGQRFMLLFDRQREPSYIAAATFARTLLSKVFEGKDTLSKDLATIRAEIKDKPEIPTELKDVLLGLADITLATVKETEKQVAHFITQIENWYDEKMERLSGIYKRHSLIFLVIISLAVAVGLNVDTLNIVQTLAKDQSLREALVQQISNNPALGTNITTTITQARDELNKLSPVVGYPIGRELKDVWNYVLMFAGWLLSAIAFSLGAPFWFDLLNKAVNLRLAGKQPKPEAETA